MHKHSTYVKELVLCRARTRDPEGRERVYVQSFHCRLNSHEKRQKMASFRLAMKSTSFQLVSSFLAMLNKDNFKRFK